MIRITIELESAITGEITQLGQMHICNDGTGSASRRNYQVAVCRKGDFNVPRGRMPKAAIRNGSVKNYPAASYNVWRLISRALRSAFPEEN